MLFYILCLLTWVLYVIAIKGQGSGVAPCLRHWTTDQKVLGLNPAPAIFHCWALNPQLSPCGSLQQQLLLIEAKLKQIPKNAVRFCIVRPARSGRSPQRGTDLGPVRLQTCTQIGFTSLS